MEIEIWSDVVCPFCYLGKRRLERALAGFAHRDEVTVVWRSFQLDPAAPASTPESNAEMLSAKYGMTLEQAHESNVRMTATAAAEGLDFHLDAAQRGNTFDAHRLIHFAAAHGRQDAMKERLLAAYFTDGLSISDHAVLAELAGSVGLDPQAAREMLTSERYSEAVRADVDQARAYGIQGVPFFVFDGKFAVSGAQPVEAFSAALAQVRDAEQAGAQRAPTGATGSGPRP